MIRGCSPHGGCVPILRPAPYAHDCRTGCVSDFGHGSCYASDSSHCGADDDDANDCGYDASSDSVLAMTCDVGEICCVNAID